jgi:hypothetical protein
LKEGEATKVQLESDMCAHQASRAEAKKAKAEATALREKEAAAYAKESGDFKTNIDAMTKASTAISPRVWVAVLSSRPQLQLRSSASALTLT